MEQTYIDRKKNEIKILLLIIIRNGYYIYDNEKFIWFRGVFFVFCSVKFLFYPNKKNFFFYLNAKFGGGKKKENVIALREVERGRGDLFEFCVEKNFNKINLSKKFFSFFISSATLFSIHYMQMIFHCCFSLYWSITFPDCLIRAPTPLKLPSKKMDKHEHKKIRLSVDFLFYWRKF